MNMAQTSSSSFNELQLNKLSAALKSELGRNHIWMVFHEPVLAVEQASDLADATYNLLAGLESITFEQIITRADFVRAWRYMLLKRAQDVQYQCVGERPDDYLQICTRGMEVPAPLADFLWSYGQYDSEVLGHRITPRAPVPPANEIPDWYLLDNVVLDKWMNACRRLSSIYEMKRFPPRRQSRGTAFMFTGRNIHQDGRVAIRSPTRETAATDAYLRAVNGDLFEDHPFNFEDLGFCNFHSQGLVDLRVSYLSSYVKVW